MSALCLVGWAVRGFARRLRRLPGPFVRLRRGARRSVRTTGIFETCVCGSSMRVMHGLPRGSVIFSLKQDAMRSATCHEMPGSCQYRCIGGGAAAEVTTRPRHWLVGSHARLDLPVHQPLRRVIATERLAHKGRTARAEVMHGAFRVRPQSSTCRPHGALGRRCPDHRCHLRRCGKSAQESWGCSRRCYRHRADRATNLVGQDLMTASSRTKETIRIGTRGSRLARWQAEWVAERLRGLNPGLNGRTGRDQDSWRS